MKKIGILVLFIFSIFLSSCASANSKSDAMSGTQAPNGEMTTGEQIGDESGNQTIYPFLKSYRVKEVIYLGMFIDATKEEWKQEHQNYMEIIEENQVNLDGKKYEEIKYLKVQPFFQISYLDLQINENMHSYLSSFQNRYDIYSSNQFTGYSIFFQNNQSFLIHFLLSSSLEAYSIDYFSSLQNI